MNPLRSAAGNLVSRSAARVLHVHDRADAPVPRAPFLSHHAPNGPHSFTHYNVVIPDLPAPHGFLACMVLSGRPGMRVFDIEHAIAGGHRRYTTTVGVGTAATAPDWFCVYDTYRDCTLRHDGTHMQFGDAVSIVGQFPDYRIVITRPGLSIDIGASCTPDVTMFAHSPIYDHMGFPATYRGTLGYQGEVTEINGVLSLEYARALPVPYPLPADLFTYQVIKLDSETLLMLTRLEILGKPVLTGAYVKTLDGDAHRQTRGVTLDMVGRQPNPRIAPDGRATRIPDSFHWTIPRLTNDGPTEIVATPTTEVIYGLGRGWIGGYHYTGTHAGKSVCGDGYYEYASLRG